MFFFAAVSKPAVPVHVRPTATALFTQHGWHGTARWQSGFCLPPLHSLAKGRCSKEAASARWAATARMPLSAGRSARARKQANEAGGFRCPTAPNFDAKHYNASTFASVLPCLCNNLYTETWLVLCVPILLWCACHYLSLLGVRSPSTNKRAVDATVVSPLTRQGEVHPPADVQPACAVTNCGTRNTCPERGHARRCRLIVIGLRSAAGLPPCTPSGRCGPAAVAAVGHHRLGYALVRLVAVAAQRASTRLRGLSPRAPHRL